MALFGIFFLIVIIPSAIIHEYAHGWMADQLGDPTARYAGRLTLNPKAHIDPWGTLLLPLILYVVTAGSFLFAYAKPVPYNPFNLKNQKWGPAMVAIAGPAANLILALVFGLLVRFIPLTSQVMANLVGLLSIVVYANVLLAVFNLVPIPPLDGSKVLFGIIQGANHEGLRKESAKIISAMDFDGIAVGGESIGYNMEATKQILDWINPIIPENKPHYTMGVGFSPTDLFDVVERGVDMFDCVAPTRIARNGSLFVSPKNLPLVGEDTSPIRRAEGVSHKYRININNAKFREDKGPIDPDCTCPVCQTYSRAYIYHLFKAQEMLAYRLATIHNLHFLLDLMRDIRTSIKEDRFLDLRKQWM